MKKVKEKRLYPIVEKWLRRNYLCFKTSINKGLKYGRIDVVGIKDVGGELSGEVETIAIEVKRGSEPFGTACGQTLGYKVYANRIYLADYREESFDPDEINIASHLGVGLVQIKNRSCKEVLSSPYYKPITKLNLLLLERIGIGKCQLCDTFFEISNIETNIFANLAKEDLKKAIENEKGIIFWNRELSDRKKRLGLDKHSDDRTYERRFICPDCICYFFSQLRNEK